MKVMLRTSLLAGLASTLALPLAAQDLEPQSVLDEDAAEVEMVVLWSDGGRSSSPA